MLQERAKPQEKRDVPLTTRGQSLLVRKHLLRPLWAGG